MSKPRTAAEVIAAVGGVLDLAMEWHDIDVGEFTPEGGLVLRFADGSEWELKATRLGAEER